MRFSNILRTAVCLSLASALPAPGGSNAPVVSVTLIGAAGAQYSIIVPLNNIPVSTSKCQPHSNSHSYLTKYSDNALSISQVSSSFDIKDQCTLETVDYPPALVEISPGLWNVGPPQTVTSIACSDTTPPQRIGVEFDGAAGAKYTLSVPLDGEVIPTSNLTLSHFFKVCLLTIAR